MDLYAIVHALLCYPIGHLTVLKAIPLHILMAVPW